MRGERTRPVGLCLAVWILAAWLGASTRASDMGLAAAARVSEASYRTFLADRLHTHPGDDRGFGPEHDLAQANIVQHFADLGLSVSLEPFLYNGGTYYNVVGTQRGTTNPQGEYVLGAHYDSVGNPGADDNASGVALVMEAARVLSARPSQYTIRYVAFDREEQGLWGSRAYVQAHSSDDVLGMISADMVAYNTGANQAEIYGRTASGAIKTALAQAVETYGAGLTWTMYGGLDASDHAPFEWFGFQACLLIEDWGNPFYHSPQDHVDMPGYIDYAYATRMTRSAVGFLVDYAGVTFDLPTGDANGDGNVDSVDYDTFLACFAAAEMSDDCFVFDFDFSAAIDCGDWTPFMLVWTDPTYPPELTECRPPAPAPAPAPHDVRKNRFLSFVPTSGAEEVAIAVELLDLACAVSGQPCAYDDDCRQCAGGENEGLPCRVDAECSQGSCVASGETCDPAGEPVLLGWIGEPFEVQSAHAPAGTLTAHVENEPLYRSWSEPLIQLGDCEIAPARAYGLSVTAEGVFYSDPLVIGTIARPAGRHWADVVGAFTGASWTPPNGLVNVDDVLAWVRFVTLKPAPHVTVVDLDGEVPNFVINATDLQLILAGFAGNTYPPFSFANQGGPAGCP